MPSISGTERLIAGTLQRAPRSDVDAAMLEDIAFEMEDEARRIDAEEAKAPANDAR